MATYRSFDERRRRFARERAWQRTRSARKIDVLGRILFDAAFAHEMPVEAAQRREATRDAGRTQSRAAQTLDVADDVVGASAGESVDAAEEFHEIAEVAAIGAQRVARRSAFGFEGSEEVGHRVDHRRR